MQSALMQVSVTKNNRRTVSDTYLLNVSRITTFAADSTGATTFYYEDIGGRRRKTHEYRYDGNVAAFKLLLRETSQRDDITINVTHKGNAVNTDDRAVYTRLLFGKKLSLNLDYFVKAVDKADGTGSYVWVVEGDNKLVCYLSTDTISKIDGTASASGSIRV